MTNPCCCIQRYYAASSVRDNVDIGVAVVNDRSTRGCDRYRVRASMSRLQI